MTPVISEKAFEDAIGCDMARFLWGTSNRQRESRLSQSVENAMRNGLKTHSVRVVPVDTPVTELIGTLEDHPVLVGFRAQGSSAS